MHEISDTGRASKSPWFHKRLSSESHALRTWLTETNRNSAIFLPFAVCMFLLRHFWHIAAYREGPPPPVMAMFAGPPGYGKSAMVSEFCARVGIERVVWSAPEFEGRYAGEPITNLQRALVNLGKTAKEKQTVGCLEVPDGDLCLGVHQNFNIGTTNLPHAMQALMSYCDDPTHVRGVDCNPVALVLTANDPGTLRSSLTRSGRCRAIPWHPSRREMWPIADHIMAPVLSPELRAFVFQLTPDWTPADYAFLKSLLIEESFQADALSSTPTEYLKLALSADKPACIDVRADERLLRKLVAQINQHRRVVNEQHIEDEPNRRT